MSATGSGAAPVEPYDDPPTPGLDESSYEEDEFDYGSETGEALNDDSHDKPDELDGEHNGEHDSESDSESDNDSDNDSDSKSDAASEIESDGDESDDDLDYAKLKAAEAAVIKSRVTSGGNKAVDDNRPEVSDTELEDDDIPANEVSFEQPLTPQQMSMGGRSQMALAAVLGVPIDWMQKLGKGDAYESVLQEYLMNYRVKQYQTDVAAGKKPGSKAIGWATVQSALRQHRLADLTAATDVELKQYTGTEHNARAVARIRQLMFDRSNGMMHHVQACDTAKNQISWLTLQRLAVRCAPGRLIRNSRFADLARSMRGLPPHGPAGESAATDASDDGAGGAQPTSVVEQLARSVVGETWGAESDTQASRDTAATRRQIKEFIRQQTERRMGLGRGRTETMIFTRGGQLVGAQYLPAPGTTVEFDEDGDVAMGGGAEHQTRPKDTHELVDTGRTVAELRAMAKEPDVFNDSDAYWQYMVIFVLTAVPGCQLNGFDTADDVVAHLRPMDNVERATAICHLYHLVHTARTDPEWTPPTGRSGRLDAARITGLGVADDMAGDITDDMGEDVADDMGEDIADDIADDMAGDVAGSTAAGADPDFVTDEHMMQDTGDQDTLRKWRAQRRHRREQQAKVARAAMRATMAAAAQDGSHMKADTELYTDIVYTDPEQQEMFRGSKDLLQKMQDSEAYQPKDYKGACKRLLIAHPSNPLIPGMKQEQGGRWLKWWQVTAIDRIFTAWENGRRGMILGDQMGMGKTVVEGALALVLYNARCTRINELNNKRPGISHDEVVKQLGKPLPHLMLLPNTLIRQVAEEIYNFFGKSLKIVIYHGKGGSKNGRGGPAGGSSKWTTHVGKLSKSSQLFDGKDEDAAKTVVISSYRTMAHRHGPSPTKAYRAKKGYSLDAIEKGWGSKDDSFPFNLDGCFASLYCDEAHTMKNETNECNILVCNMDVPRVLLVTGTPIWNRASDLQGLLKVMETPEQHAMATYGSARYRDRIRQLYPLIGERGYYPEKGDNPYDVEDFPLAATSAAFKRFVLMDPKLTIQKSKSKQTAESELKPHEIHAQIGKCIAKALSHCLVRRTYQSSITRNDGTTVTVADNLPNCWFQVTDMLLPNQAQELYSSLAVDYMKHLMRPMKKDPKRMIMNAKNARMLTLLSLCPLIGAGKIPQKVFGPKKTKAFYDMEWPKFFDMLLADIRTKSDMVDPLTFVPALPITQREMDSPLCAAILLAPFLTHSPTLSWLLARTADQVIRRGEKNICWTLYPFEQIFITKMFEAFGIRSRAFMSTLTAEERTTIKDSFNDTDDEHTVQALVNSFSLSAAGMNLQGGGRFVNVVDPPHSRPMQEQAIHRSYRLGQRRDVFVNEINVGGTFSAKMRSGQIDKHLPTLMAMLDQAVFRSTFAKDAATSKGTSKRKSRRGLDADGEDMGEEDDEDFETVEADGLNGYYYDNDTGKIYHESSDDLPEKFAGAATLRPDDLLRKMFEVSRGANVQQHGGFGPQHVKGKEIWAPEEDLVVPFTPSKTPRTPKTPKKTRAKRPSPSASAAPSAVPSAVPSVAPSDDEATQPTAKAKAKSKPKKARPRGSTTTERQPTGAQTVYTMNEHDEIVWPTPDAAEAEYTARVAAMDMEALERGAANLGIDVLPDPDDSDTFDDGDPAALGFDMVGLKSVPRTLVGGGKSASSGRR